MAKVRRPLDRCPVALSLDVIGERWTLLIVRDLLDGPARFQDLSESLAPVAPSVLSSRLKRLAENGLVVREFYSDYPPRAKYRLTDAGRDLRPIVGALYNYGRKHLGHRTDAQPT